MSLLLTLTRYIFPGYLAGVTVNSYSPKKITPGVKIAREKSTPGVIFSWEKFTPTWKKVLP